MTRHFGIQTARAGLTGGTGERPLSRHGARNTGAELLPPLPAESLKPFSRPLERLDGSETVKDIIALSLAFLFLCSVGVGFAVALFICFFVQT